MKIDDFVTLLDSEQGGKITKILSKNKVDMFTCIKEIVLTFLSEYQVSDSPTKVCLKELQLK